MGLTLYNLKCTCVLLNAWDPWRFLISFWAGCQDTCPILISPFFTFCTMRPYIKLHLTKRFCSLKIFFNLLKAYRMYLALYMLLFFKNGQNYSPLDKTFYLLSCVTCDPQDLWCNLLCPFLHFTGFIYFCHQQRT